MFESFLKEIDDKTGEVVEEPLPDFITFEPDNPEMLRWVINITDISLDGTEYVIGTRLIVNDGYTKENGENTTDSNSEWVLTAEYIPYFPPNEPPDITKELALQLLFINETKVFSLLPENFSNDTVEVILEVPKKL